MLLPFSSSARLSAQLLEPRIPRPGRKNPRGGALAVLVTPGTSTSTSAAEDTSGGDALPLAVLDFVGIEHGESATDSLRGAVGIARAVEDAGYRRYWVSEHHNMRSLACSAPEILVAHVAAHTRRVRVGAAGIMLPNHASLKVAETFRTLVAMHPGRIDLALGRAPGTDPLTAHVLRRGLRVDPAAEFPQQVAELLAFLGDGFPDGHPYAPLVAAPVVQERPQLFVLGSSPYGPQFAAVNGFAAAFAHHMSPEIAVDVLREYRRAFRPREEGDAPYAAMSVLAFASEDEAAQREFVAGWTLTMRNLARGVREPLRPEEVRALAGSEDFPAPGRDDGRMVVGEPRRVAERLRTLQVEARADEVVVVTPSIDRSRRADSYRALAAAWRATS
jgi:luciferase family oxidoreductase group 1